MASQNEKFVNETEEDGIFADCSFTDLGLSAPLSEQLKERMGFTAPTLIQKRTIPSIISGRDVLVNAGTGTGKTIVYLAPIINRLQAYSPKISRTDGAFALVIVPTRELCLQVYEVLQKLLHRFHWIVPGYIMGGENRSKEKARLRKGINILIATPGRLLDHLKHTSSFTHNRLSWLIFDEADRLFDLGFGKAVEEILLLLKSTLDTSTKSKESVKVQQNILLSATLTEQVNNLAKISLKNPITIGLEDKRPLQGKEKDSSNLRQNLVSDEKNGSCGPAPPSEYRFPAKLVQRYMKIPCRLRLVALLGFLQSQVKLESSSKVVVFFSTCDAVDFHYALINQFHWNSPVNLGDDSEENFLHCKLFRLHGNMTQDERKDTFHGFSKENSAVLLCTDVAARGLDFPKVRCIVQYDSPGDATEYVHRVGRTARLDQKGEAMLFLQPIEMDYLQELQNHGVHLNEMQVEKILNILQPSSNKMMGGKWAVVEMHPAAIAMQKALEAFILTEESMKQLAKDAFCSFVRSYAAHRGDLKRIFQVKKLHLGHVAKSFGLKDQPSLVGKSFNKQNKKRQRAEKLKHGPRKKRRNT